MGFLHGPWIPESSHLMWTQSHKAVKTTDVCSLKEEDLCAKGESPQG